ncbi:MAG: phosphopantetheine-binding protein [Candidatus Marinimicrobia bacterium]|nr:phosphopantetheine-binding protein [Candidatus Neomarinimicrobiota bacterium]
MEKVELISRVKKVIAQVLEISESDVTDDANFIFDLGADSMQSLQLAAAFEEEFEIEMEEDEALGVQTVSGAVELIGNLVNA